MSAQLPLFYETRDDLLQIISSYSEAGLRDNERCLVVLPESFLEDFGSRLPGGVELTSIREMASGERTCAGGRVAVVMAGGEKGVPACHRTESIPQAAIASRCSSLHPVYSLADMSALEMADLLARNKAAACVRNGRVEPLKAGSHALDPRVLHSEHMEEQLRFKESQLERSRRLAHVGTWHWDIRGGTVTWCPEIHRMLGVDAEKCAPTVAGFLERVHPEDRPSLVSVLEGGRRLGEATLTSFRIVRADGTVRHLESAGEPGFDSQGHQVGRFGALQDVTERRLAEERLRESNDEFRALSARLASTREDEGRRISREIHDELGAALTTLKWNLEAAGKLCGETSGPDPIHALQPRLEAMKNTVEQTLTAVRRIASELRPSLLDDLGLLDAIEWQAEQFHQRTGLACVCNWSLESAALNGDQSTALFRILQEALTNVARHANATRVDIEAHQEGGEFVLSIRDDGRGIGASEQGGRRSLGLLGMRERAQLMGGTLQISSPGGVGTSIVVRAPLRNPLG